jgi:hypothetical protein
VIWEKMIYKIWDFKSRLEEDLCVANYQKTIKDSGGGNVREITPPITEFLAENNSNCGKFYSSLVL